ncbi:mitochondrial inner membrane protease ATP23 [Iris pallida]|uniref:Mitochondrial inner membrane protease ATP23 n=1 Tax=Iris pallida TaxID=29817 RepID=A0AAX6DMC6_IRIPA|nr:mitochondrial inner membrane protease ATP23 [Iris pallida]KAJ6792951.1 mitochondrial inner membrane protease ATP23 [Iris pallida]
MAGGTAEEESAAATASASAGGGCEVPIRLDASTVTEKENPNGGMNQKECMERIAKGLKHPTVKFLREHMEKAGCPFWVKLILAADCKTQGVAGRYTSRHGISVCCNNLTYQDEVNQVLIHELVHAYDDCRVKNMDWKNCAHHACSEIRANHLSGDCHYKRELLRGFMKIRGHEQDCVKRRALKSVENNPYCSGAAAKDAIESVWDICYDDTYPFDRAP